jgi:uncharacterized protein (DUF427 family)
MVWLAGVAFRLRAVSQEAAMNKSPGHQSMPNHKVEEERVPQAMKVDINGQTIAQSSDVIRVKEDGHPDRFYFPRSDVEMSKLERTATTTECPFKGKAHYFNIHLNGQRLNDAVWTYEQPYDEHRNLKDRVAFYDDKIPEIHIRTA